MKKMNTKQKIRWNKLSARRRIQHMKRKPRVEALKKAQKKRNLTLRQEETIRYFRAKYGNKKPPPQTAPLI